MAKLEDITVEIGAKLTVDGKTADLALRLVEMYVNDTGAKVIVEQKENGEVEFHYEPA